MSLFGIRLNGALVKISLDYFGVLVNMATDLQISPKTAKAWLEVLERMYLVFSVRPHAKYADEKISRPSLLRRAS